MLNPSEETKVSSMRCGVNRDGCYSFGTHFSARVLRVADEEWRSDKLIMPEVPVLPNDLPPEDGDSNMINTEDDKTWKDLSVNEMINFATMNLNDIETLETNENNISGFYLDSRYFNQGNPLI